MAGDQTRYVSVMAQELLEIPNLRHAMITSEDRPFTGFYGVGYKALGIRSLTETAYENGELLLAD
jgi:hypothetical protein